MYPIMWVAFIEVEVDIKLYYPMAELHRDTLMAA